MSDEELREAVGTFMEDYLDRLDVAEMFCRLTDDLVAAHERQVPGSIVTTDSTGGLWMETPFVEVQLEQTD